MLLQGVGTALNIKPVMRIQDGKPEAHAKARGKKAAFRIMCRALCEELDTRLKPLHDSKDFAILKNTDFSADENKTRRALRTK